MASKWRGSAVEGAMEWTRRRLGSPFTNLHSYSFANQAKQCGWGCSEIDVAATCIFQRKFVPYSYYIRTISPYLYDIRAISGRTSAVRPYGVRTVSVRRPYGICTASVRNPAYIRYLGCTDPFPLSFFNTPCISTRSRKKPKIQERTKMTSTPKSS